MKTNRYQVILAAMAMSVLLTGCQFGKKEKKDPQPKEDAGQVEEMSEDTDQKKDSADSEKDEYFDQLYGHIWAQAKKAKEDQPDQDKKGEENEEKKETEPLPDDHAAFPLKINPIKTQNFHGCLGGAGRKAFSASGKNAS